MSYTPTEWVTGDIITANKLNHIEQGVDDMSTEPYVPTEWVTGDVITAEKLNHIEQGIVSGSGGGDTIIAPEQSVTTTDSVEPGNYFGVITTVPEWEYDENFGIPINWVVTVDGVTVPYDAREDCYKLMPTDDAYGYEIFYDDTDTSLVIFVYGKGETGTIGATVTVSITEPASGPEYWGGIGSDYIIAAPKQTVTTSYNEGTLDCDAIITFADGYSYDTSIGLPSNWCVFVNGYFVPYDENYNSYNVSINDIYDREFQFMIQGGQNDNPVVLVTSEGNGQGNWEPIEFAATVTILQPAAGPLYPGTNPE